MTDVRMLLSCHCQVSLLQLLAIDCILEHGQVVECLLFVQVASSFSKFNSEGAKDVVNSICTNQVKHSIKGALLIVFTRSNLVLQQINKASEHLILIVDEFIVDLTFKTASFKLVFAVFAIFQLNLIHIDFVDIDGVLAPLTSQVFFVHSKETAIFSNLNLNLWVLWAMRV